jgi:DNA-binding CsgD family transcriptional regulator
MAAHSVGGKIGADSGAVTNRKESFRLRISGKTYAQIGEVLGISRQAVCEHVNNELKAIRAENKQLAEHYRDIELSRLEMLFDVITKAVEAGDLTVLQHAHKNSAANCSE